MLERRRDKSSHHGSVDPTGNRSDISFLPGPSKQRTPMIRRFLYCWLVVLLFLCLCYWMVRPTVHKYHIQHEMSSHVNAMTDWIWEQLVTCFPLLPSTLPRAATLKIINHSFKEGIKGWKNTKGNPSTQTDPKTNSYWIARAPDSNGYSCSSQTINLHHGIQIETTESQETTQEMTQDKILYFLDQGFLMINGSISLRIPETFINPRSMCTQKNHFCDANFHDHVWFEMSYYSDKQENGLELNMGSLRTKVADSSRWTVFTLEGVVPPLTRSIELSICGQHREGVRSEGMVDDVGISLSVLPKKLRDVSILACAITKKPMLRKTGEGEGIISIIWESDTLFHEQRLEWGWEPGRIFNLSPVQTTFVDACHFIHKAKISFSDIRYQDPLVDQYEALFYRVQCGTTESDLYRYTIPSIPFSYSSTKIIDTRIALISDNQYGSQTMRHVVNDIQTFHPDLLLMGGDIVNRGYLIEEWGMYFWYPLEVAQLAQRTPIVITRGNHDGQSGLAFAYTAAIDNHDWFAFSHGVARYIILDSNADTATAPHQLEWLKRELQSDEYRDALFRIVMFHLPPFTELWSPKEGYNGEEFVREDWVPLFERYHVDVVISGHTHAYCRGFKNGVMYAIIGGAGGMVDDERVFDWKMFDVTKSEHHFVIIDFEGCNLKWNVHGVHNEEGELLDSLVLSSKSNHKLCQSVALAE